MASTISQLKERLRDAMGGRTDKESQLALWLQTALDRVVRAYDFPALRGEGTLTTEADVQAYELSSIAPDCKAITSIRCEGAVVAFVPSPWLDVWMPRTSSKGKPRYWWMVSEGQLGLLPTPDDSYELSVRYLSWVPQIGDDDSELPLEHMDDVIIAGALVEYYLSIQEYRDAANWESVFQRRLMEAGQNALYQPAGTLVLGKFSAAGVGRGVAPQEDPWYGRTV